MGGAYGRFDERPVHEVEVAAFAIDPHEVTVQAFSAFVEATAHVTNHFINAERRDVLEVIYTTDALFANHAQFAHYLSEIVGLTLRQLPPERVEALMPVFELPHFRATILYFFIDYDHLGGYYGQILRRLPPLDDPEALFHACILGYFDYLRGGDMPVMPLRTPAELRSYYPVLSGRYVGTLFLSASHSSGYLRRSYIRQLCLWHAPHLVCFEIVPALILIRDFETLHWLYDLHYEELYDQDNWATSQMTNLYLIGEAFLYLSEGNLKRARLICDSIQLDHTSLAYDRYVRLFHGVMSLELFAEDGASAEARAAVVDQLTTEVAATGFTRFLGISRPPSPPSPPGHPGPPGHSGPSSASQRFAVRLLSLGPASCGISRSLAFAICNPTAKSTRVENATSDKNRQSHQP